FFHAVPDAGADAGEEGDAVGGAFAGVGEDQGLFVDVGLQLTPEVGAGAAARGADLGDGDAHLSHDFQGIAHAVGDAFQQGADQVRAGGAGGEADPGAAGGGVGVGAALAGEVGQEEQPLGPRGGFLG